MARLGAFDPQLVPLAWFDENAVVEGWFGPDLIGASSGGVAYTADITPTSYSTTTASISALLTRLASVTPVSYETIAAGIGVDRTWRAGITPTSYAMTPAAILATYSGEPPSVGGLLLLLRRRRR